LRDVISRLADHPMKRIGELLPGTPSPNASPATPPEAA
jgi:hypothetical protein